MNAGHGRSQAFPVECARLGNLATRHIPRAEADLTLAEPERIETVGLSRAVYMRRYNDARLGQEMLLRAVIDEQAEEQVVVTVYITSKIGKYMAGRISP